ncbi:hypothetical protein NQ318_021331 [Aromia moschata]|uniref:Secreted protein n=1 Tax=Aromia moschata TaxID=1265417 RepID=A0AAV8ZC89_9CUCU|nr:hypothetical protein NQ318_021331 [Aromia moschata]
MAAAAVSHLFCFIYSLPVSPLFHIQNFTLTLYPINKNLCHKIDPYRDVVFHLYTRLLLRPSNHSLKNDSTTVVL